MSAKKIDDQGHKPYPFKNARKFEGCLLCPAVHILGYPWEKPCPNAPVVQATAQVAQR